MDMSGGAAVLEAIAAIAELGLPLELVAVRAGDREHAERDGHQARRHHHPAERQDGRGEQHRRRGAADPRRRAHLLRARARRRPSRRHRHADRRRRGRARLDLRRADLQRRRLGRAGARGRRAHGRAGLAPAAPPRVQGADPRQGRRPHQRLGEAQGRRPSTPASFLEEFVDGKPWAHLDIAGTAWDVGRAYVGNGPTGFGVRLLVALARDLAGDPS